MNPAVACELPLASLGHGPGSPREYCLRQSPMDERAFVEIYVFSREVPARQWKKQTNKNTPLNKTTKDKMNFDPL